MPNENTSYYTELTHNLKHGGFTVGPEENNILPVELDGQPLCRATENGGVRWHESDITDDRRSALDSVISIAKTTHEYMRQIETAPKLTADGLEGDYRLLSEFNGTVLAGHPTEYGVQFVTWERTHNKTGLWQGHYIGPGCGIADYTAAKQDFAVRSGLIPASALFTPEQLTEIYLHDVAGALASQPGMKQQTFVTAGFCAGAGPSAGGIGYMEEISPTLKAAESGTNMVPSVLCLNDQGGGIMDLSEDMSGTLSTQEHGHQPLVYENHGIDCRCKGPLPVAPTLSARAGTGGNNLPIALQPETICISGNTISVFYCCSLM